jgi:hypothetical protein
MKYVADRNNLTFGEDVKLLTNGNVYDYLNDNKNLT